MPKSADDTVCGIYEVPNTVIAYWGGWGGAFGRFYVGWGARLRALRGHGYYVEEYRFRYNTTWASANEDINGVMYGLGGTAKQDLQDKLTAAGQSKTLQGLYYWGHGWEKGLYNQDKWPHQQLAVQYETVTVPYGLGLLWIYACESSYAQPILGSDAPGMSLEGSASGELIPLPFGAYIDF